MPDRPVGIIRDLSEDEKDDNTVDDACEGCGCFECECFDWDDAA